MSQGPKTRRQRQSEQPSARILAPTPPKEPPSALMIVVSEELRRTITQKLEEYDSDANNFVILDSLAEKKPEFMKSHKTSIPIGENCQAELPLFLGSEIYAVKSQYYNDMLDGLRISCRKEDQTSYTPRLKKFREEMGEERTEEEFAFSCKYYKQSNPDLNYVEYLRTHKLWLEDFFDSLYIRKGNNKKSATKGLKKLPQNVKSASTRY